MHVDDASSPVNATGHTEAGVDHEAHAEQTAQAEEAAASHSREKGGWRAAFDRERAGKWMLTLGVLMFAFFAFLPAPYVISSPGPAFNAVGNAKITVDGDEHQQDVISISGAEEYEPDAGQIFVMTVNVAGNPESQPRWFEVMSAWLDPSRDVKPVELYYPEGVTTEQRNQRTTQMMLEAQDTAIAAALSELDYDIEEEIVVGEVLESSAAKGILQPGDKIIAVGDEKVATMETPGKFHLEAEPTVVEFERDGKRQRETITPTLMETSEGQRPMLGITLQYSLKFPVDINIELGEVGGPSAGLAFALSIYDLMTPDNLTNGKNVAATGTITPDGQVGGIGGVRQKFHAAVEIGADYFLVPESNCAEAIGSGAPTDIPVYAIRDLDEALQTVESLGEGSETGVRTCKQAVDAGIPQE